MKKGLFVLIAISAVLPLASVMAEPTTVINEEPALGVTFSVDYFNRYISDGYDVYSDNDAAIQPSIAIDLWDTNFSVMVWGSWAFDNAHQNSEELNYIISYSNSIFEDAALQTDFEIAWAYCDFYDNGSKGSDEQNIEVILSWPNVCEKITPFYAPKKYWPASESGETKGGWLHKFGFNMPFKADCPMLQADLNLTFDITYNDGYSGSDHDWSHSTILIETEPINIGNGKLTPAIGYQISMDDSVNTDDEFIFGANYSISF